MFKFYYFEMNRKFAYYLLSIAAEGKLCVLCATSVANVVVEVEPGDLMPRKASYPWRVGGANTGSSSRARYRHRTKVHVGSPLQSRKSKIIGVFTRYTLYPNQ